jgi:hypothetical protein
MYPFRRLLSAASIAALVTITTGCGTPAAPDSAAENPTYFTIATASGAGQPKLQNSSGKSRDSPRTAASK